MSAALAYLENLIAGFSHLFNALTGGSARHSFSARIGAAAYDGALWAVAVERIINSLAFSDDHCREHAVEEGLLPAEALA